VKTVSISAHKGGGENASPAAYEAYKAALASGEEEIIDLAMETFGAGNFAATTLEDISIKRIKQSFPEARAALSLGRDLSQVPKSGWR
jgi:hypothetical protein